MKKILSCISICSCLVMLGCESFSEKKRLARVLNDEANGFVQAKKLNETDLTLQLIPSSLMFEQEAGAKPDQSWIAKLTVQLPAGRLTREASDYLNLGIRDRFYSITGMDTTKCIMFERIPGVRTNQYVYLLSFPSSPGDADWSLLLNDEQIGLGQVSFDFSKGTIKKLKDITN